MARPHLQGRRLLSRLPSVLAERVQPPAPMGGRLPLSPTLLYLLLNSTRLISCCSATQAGLSSWCSGERSPACHLYCNRPFNGSAQAPESTLRVSRFAGFLSSAGGHQTVSADTDPSSSDAEALRIKVSMLTTIKKRLLSIQTHLSSYSRLQLWGHLRLLEEHMRNLFSPQQSKVQ